MLFTCRSTESKSWPSLSILCEKERGRSKFQWGEMLKQAVQNNLMFLQFTQGWKCTTTVSSENQSCLSCHITYTHTLCIHGCVYMHNTPGCVVDEGFCVVLREIIRLKLFTGGDTGPSLFCRSTCWWERSANACRAYIPTHTHKSILNITQTHAQLNSTDVVLPSMRNMRWSSSSTVDPGKRGLPVIIS